MEEIWKDVKNYEGLYQISNLGRLKSVERIYKNRKCKELIKKTSVANGYERIGLSKNGEIKYFSIHRLVAEAFIDNPKNLPCINHKDTNKRNNKVDNLEWCTHKENNNYGNHYNKIMLKRVIKTMNKYFPEEKGIISILEDLRIKMDRCW